VKRLVTFFLIANLAQVALAEDVPRPVARGSLETVQPDIKAPPLRPETERRLALSKARPTLRPASAQDIAISTRPAELAFLSPEDAGRPFLRPPDMLEKVMARKRARKKGSVCGDIDIQGEVVGYVPGRIRACGITDAVRVRSVSGVALSTNSLMNCRTAKALNSWVRKGVQPAFQGNGGVKKLRVAAHYACRTRNNRPGAKISEHGKGNAIDISAFYLQDGSVATVLTDWNGRFSKALRRVHKAACGPFGTVLGPNSDRYHRDHFHFDTARYRSGPFCR
jgi:hypothetical protein